MSRLQSTKPVLNFKQFLLRQEVLSLYRTIFRSIRKLPDKHHQEELKEWARRDFRSNLHHTDETTIKMCIQYGRRCLRQLETNLSLAK